MRLTCVQLADIRDQFDEIKEYDLSQDHNGHDINGPMLLDGGQATYDLPTVLDDMPPREVADKLIFRYFNSAENSIGTFDGTQSNAQY